MGESRRRKALGGGHIRPAVDIDFAIEEMERLVDSGRVEGFAQVAVCTTGHPGVFEYKVMSFGLEKQETFDALCIGRRSMMEMLGFKDIQQGEEGDG